MITSTRMLTDVEQLQTLPVSFALIYSLANDQESSIEDLVEALRPDPALTSNILRLANSPFFGCQRQVGSIKQALMILGTKKLIKIAIGGAFSRVIPNVMPGYGINASQFWCHCIAVAMLSELMSKEVGLKDQDAGFVCGLLHDIGKLVTSTYLAGHTDQVLDSIEEGCGTMIAAERKVMDLDHCRVGAAVAEKWGLPGDIGRVARLHHTPGEAEELLVDLVHVADGLAHSLGYGTDIGELAREIDPEALARTGLSPQGLEMVACGAMVHIESMCGLFVQTTGEG